MKSSRETEIIPPFVPITITIETEKELKLLHQLVDGTTDKDNRIAEILGKDKLDIRNIIVKLHDEVSKYD